MKASDLNLLFGVLALQLDFIRRDDLVRGMNAWVLKKHLPLGHIMEEQKLLTTERRALLDGLVNEHIKQHDNDPEKSLAAVAPETDGLREITDAEVQDSLARLPDDPFATRAHRLDEPLGTPQRFRVLRPHARGGLGEVFVAEDLELHREVALKEIQTRFADDLASRTRFLLEAEVTGGLEHPGIVPVYGLGQYADGRPFYAMRFIKGDSLKDALAQFHACDWKRRELGERTVAFRKLLGRFVDVCNAIAYAHSRGVLHRDLKPANIMLGKYGETLVVDWGMAKAVDHQATLPLDEQPLRPASSSGTSKTVPGMVVGTPQYMSPEQAVGRLDRIGPASDVYSLGATLYCILTGQPPFSDTETDKVLHKVRLGDFPRPRKIKRQVQRALEAICLKAMARAPQDRYPSPRALADDIEDWLADEPTSVASAERVVDRTRRWFRRHKTVATGVVVLLLTAVAALSLSNAVIADARDHAHQQWVEAEAARQDVARRAEAEEVANQRLRQTLYFNRIALVERELASNNVPRAHELLHSWRNERSGWEWHYLHRRVQDREPFLDIRASERIMSMGYSPDGTRLIAGDLGGTVRVWNALTGKEVKSLRPESASRAGALSTARDGRLAVAHSSTLSASSVKIYESSDAATELVSFAGPQGLVSCIQFSPDGRWLALGASSGAAHIYDSATGKEILVLRRHDRPLRCAAFDSAGRRLATCGDDNLIRVWELPSGKLLHTLEGHISEVLSVAFSPDDRKLASSSNIGNIRLWDADTGARLLELFGDSGPIRQVAFHPDGTRLASANYDRSIKLWDVATGLEVLALRGHDDDVSCVAFSPDGNWLASASWDGHIHLYDARPLTEKPRYQLFTLQGHQQLVDAVRYHPDGRQLYSGSSDGTIHTWDAETGRHLSTMKGQPGMVISLDVAADGKRLLAASATGHVHIWDIERGTILSTRRNQKSAVWGAVFNHDATHVACISGFDGSISIWDARTGQDVRTTYAHDGGAFAIAYSSDGKYMASGGFDRTAKVFDAGTGDLLHTLTGHTNAVYRVAFSRDGKMVATASADKTVRLWDLKTAKEIMLLRGHIDRVHDVEFSPDGSLVVSSGADGVVKVWRTSDGKETVTLRGQDGVVVDAAISPDGRRLASSFGFRESGGIIIWDFAAIAADSKVSTKP